MAERVRRALTERLKERGFIRSKPTFWVRPKEHVIEFVHLHLFTFAPAFRAHFGIRVLNDEFDAPALNGPNSGQPWRDNQPIYDLDFSEDESSTTRCAEQIAKFCSEVGEPWFRRFANPQDLLAVDSPLREPARSQLASSLKGHPNAEAIRRSRLLIGVA